MLLLDLVSCWLTVTFFFLLVINLKQNLFYWQEFLRRLPDCIFESENYEDLVATSNIVDQDERARQIKGYELSC